MTKPVVTKAYFERAQFIIEGTGELNEAPSIVYKGLEVKPSYFKSDELGFKIEYDMICGNNHYPLDSGVWVLDLSADFSPVSANYSIDNICYKLKVKAEDKIYITSHYNKNTLKGVKRLINFILSLGEKAITLAIRCVYNISYAFNKKGNIVLFTSESRNTPGGNMAYVIEKAHQLEIDKKYDFKYSLIDKKDCNEVKYALFLIKTAYMLGKAKTVIIDDYHPLIYRVNFKKDVKVVQLWHACGNFKAVGYARCGKDGAPNISKNAHKNYTHAIVSGEGVRRSYAEAFGIDVNNVYACGVPRTDTLFSDTYKSDALKEIDAKYPQFKGKSKILFAPTFRGNGKKSAYYPVDKIDLDKLEKLCRATNRAVFFKMHPFVKDKIEIKKEQEDIFVDATSYPDINKMIACSEVLITDYSSSIYEAALLKTPMMFYVFDLDEYTSSRAFFKPFNEYLSGKVVYNFDELTDAINDQDYETEKIEALINSAVEKCDGNATKRVVDLIFD
ncbi:MAG: CDP-glycerol glycerophosphotransferase family protein [Acutalibacteraceae bacterium]|nr:CDP-glycerol glycerophosphotransferase family protein [Acutalibacteraceae bacterium]